MPVLLSGWEQVWRYKFLWWGQPFGVVCTACYTLLLRDNRRRNSHRHRTHRNNRLRRGFEHFDVLT